MGCPGEGCLVDTATGGRVGVPLLAPPDEDLGEPTVVGGAGPITGGGVDPRTPPPPRPAAAEGATGGAVGEATTGLGTGTGRGNWIDAIVGCGTVANVLSVGTRVGSDVGGGEPGLVPQ